MGPRSRSERRARRGCRHRRERDPVRSADPAEGRKASPFPADAAVDHAAPGAPDHQARALRLPALPERADRDAARHLLEPRAVRDPDAASPALEADREGWAPSPRAAGPGPGAAREADPGLLPRLQAHPRVE